MFVYAIYNQKADKVYIGQTNNLDRRLDEHNQKSKHYTGKLGGEWVLIYSELLPTRQGAIARERQLKSFRGREYIKSFIPA